MKNLHVTSGTKAILNGLNQLTKKVVTPSRCKQLFPITWVATASSLLSFSQASFTKTCQTSDYSNYWFSANNIRYWLTHFSWSHVNISEFKALDNYLINGACGASNISSSDGGVFYNCSQNWGKPMGGYMVTLCQQMNATSGQAKICLTTLIQTAVDHYEKNFNLGACPLSAEQPESPDYKLAVGLTLAGVSLLAGTGYLLYRHVKNNKTKPTAVPLANEIELQVLEEQVEGPALRSEGHTL